MSEDFVIDKGDCYYTDYFSEETGNGKSNSRVCSEDRVITDILCSGSRCDNIKL